MTKSSKFNTEAVGGFYGMTISRGLKWLMVLWISKQAIVIIGSLTSVGSLIFPWLTGAAVRGVQVGHPRVIQYNPRDENYDFVFLAMLQGSPLVVKGLDHSKLQRTLTTVDGVQSVIKSSKIRDVKLSVNNTFTYFSYSAEWKRRYDIKPAFEQKIDVDSVDLSSMIAGAGKSLSTGASTCTDESQRERSSSGEDMKPLYVYATHDVPNPLNNKVLNSLVPYLDRIGQLSGTTAPSSVLWMGSQNVTATDHFDVDHNFFWQISGSKRFVLTSTDAHPNFRPYGRFHPSWRQAQSPSSSTTHIAAKSLTFSSLLSATVPVSYEIILSEGDLLYIPPMMFHTVTSLSNSISFNIWSESKERQLESKLAKFDLPISTENSTVSENVAALANAIVIILRKLGRSVKSFIFTWRLQWQDLLHDSTYQCSEEDRVDSIGYPDDLCHTPATLLIIQTQLHKTQPAYFSRTEAKLTEKIPAVLKHATSVANAIKNMEDELKPTAMSLATRLAHSDLLLMQHFEEILKVLIGSSISPCHLDYFAYNILQVWKPYIEKSHCISRS